MLFQINLTQWGAIELDVGAQGPFSSPRFMDDLNHACFLTGEGRLKCVQTRYAEPPPESGKKPSDPTAFEIEGVDAYEVSPSRRHLIYRSGSTWQRARVHTPGKSGKLALKNQEALELPDGDSISLAEASSQEDDPAISLTQSNGRELCTASALSKAERCVEREGGVSALGRADWRRASPLP